MCTLAQTNRRHKRYQGPLTPTSLGSDLRTLKFGPNQNWRCRRLSIGWASVWTRIRAIRCKTVPSKAISKDRVWHNKNQCGMTTVLIKPELTTGLITPFSTYWPCGPPSFPDLAGKKERNKGNTMVGNFVSHLVLVRQYSLGQSVISLGENSFLLLKMANSTWHLNFIGSTHECSSTKMYNLIRWTAISWNLLIEIIDNSKQISG